MKQNTFYKNLSEILLTIFQTNNNFYKKEYNRSNLKRSDIIHFDKTILNTLPFLTENELINTPYKNRCLFEKAGFHKLVFLTESKTHLLIHRTLEEIKNDYIPYKGKRPLVLMENIYEAIEHSLYFYEHKTLPLIGEFFNPPVVFATAKQYAVDNLILDHKAVEIYKKTIIKQDLPLISVTIVDEKIETEDLLWPKNIQVHAVINHPLIGAIAYLCPKARIVKSPIFHPLNNVSIEVGKSSILTSSRLIACPMIRYKSDLSLKETATNCHCRKTSIQFF